MATSMKKSKPESEKPAILVCPNAVLNQHIWQSTKLSAEDDYSGHPVLGICHPGTIQRSLEAIGAVPVCGQSLPSAGKTRKATWKSRKAAQKPRFSNPSSDLAVRSCQPAAATWKIIAST